MLSAPAAARRLVPTPVTDAVRIWPSAVASITARQAPSSIEKSVIVVSDFPWTFIQVLNPQMPSPATDAPIACIASLAATIRWVFGMLAAISRASRASVFSSAPIASGRLIRLTTSASVSQIGLSVIGMFVIGMFCV